MNFLSYIFRLLSDYAESLKPKKQLSYFRNGKLIWRDCKCSDCKENNICI